MVLLYQYEIIKKISDFGASGYIPRLVVTKTCIDDKAAAQFLDCCA
ncbi:MAG: hypothetical protein ACYSTT_08425 [Planctomycetota bacterium]